MNRQDAMLVLAAFAFLEARKARLASEATEATVNASPFSMDSMKRRALDNLLDRILFGGA